MLSSFSVACPHASCGWIGSLVPSRVRGGAGMESEDMPQAWFQCPRCGRDWEARIRHDQVVSSAQLEVVNPSVPDGQLPKVETTGSVKIITFTPGKMREVENVIAQELKGRTEALGETHLLLDFTHVEMITSLELGTLINLHKKVECSGGRLTLFNMSARIFEVFAVTRLDGFLEICREDSAKIT